MASAGKEPPDAAPFNKFYKCHSNQKVGAVVCILCGEFQHTNEAVAKYNSGVPIKFLSSSFIICQDHPNFALTSKLPYGEVSGPIAEFIAHYKNEDREILKQEIIQEIQVNLDISKSPKGTHNETIYEDLSENEALKIENDLLKQLYKEVQEKNQILNELLTKEKTSNNKTPNMTIKTYAETLTQKVQNKKAKKVPKLIITKINNNDKTNLEKKVCNMLTSNKTIQTKKVITKSKDKIIVNCMNVKSIEVFENELKRELNQNFKIEKEQIKNPIMKIVGISKEFKTKEELEIDINERNFNDLEEKCKVLTIFSNEISTGAIIEVTSNLYKTIKENKSRIFIGHLNCKVYDVINTNPCVKCAGFGHGGKKCNNDPQCYKCAGQHTAKQCTSNMTKCRNCEYSNTKFKTNYNINHSAIDSELCEILKKKVQRYIESTDYPIEPTYQRFFGKVGNYRVTQENGEKEKEATLPTTNTTSSSNIQNITLRNNDTPFIRAQYQSIRNGRNRENNR